MLAQGNKLRLRDQGGSRESSRTQDQKTRTVSTCWSNPGGPGSFPENGSIFTHVGGGGRLYIRWIQEGFTKIELVNFVGMKVVRIWWFLLLPDAQDMELRKHQDGHPCRALVCFQLLTLDMHLHPCLHSMARLRDLDPITSTSESLPLPSP